MNLLTFAECPTVFLSFDSLNMDSLKETFDFKGTIEFILLSVKSLKFISFFHSPMNFTPGNHACFDNTRLPIKGKQRVKNYKNIT